MTDEEFLKRWSRRKRQPAKAAKPAADPAPRAADEAGQVTARAEPPFDPATLPPIDSITAVSDISAFLQQGVPAELTRAALRHVWTADPAIRDFVGLAENAWDFTDPDAMPGFGPLEMNDEVRRMIGEIVDTIGRAAQPDVPGAEAGHADVSQNSNVSSPVEPLHSGEKSSPAVESEASSPTALPAENFARQVLVQSNKDDLASQHDAEERSGDVSQLPRRSHGRALPR
jgi:hypothetical protein